MQAEEVRLVLVVEDWEGTRTMHEVVPSSEITGIVDGEQIFNIMNARCGFRLWTTAVLETRGGQRDEVYQGWERQVGVKNNIQRCIDRDRSTPSTDLCIFTLEVRKRRERPGNGPRGAEPASHPGTDPWHGPRGGWPTPDPPQTGPEEGSISQRLAKSAAIGRGGTGGMQVGMHMSELLLQLAGRIHI